MCCLFDHICAGHQGATGQSASGSDKKLKVEPPKPLNGKSRDLVNFLFTLKSYLDVKAVTAEAMKIALAATRLEGDALVCWGSVTKAGMFTSQAATFDNWCEALQDQFCTLEHELKLHHCLHELKQTKSVQLYTGVFRASVLELNLHSQMSDSSLKYQFMEGLKPKIEEQVYLQCPDTLNNAIELAERADAALQLVHRPAQSYDASQVVPMELGAEQSGQPRAGQRNSCYSTVQGQRG